MSVAGSFTQAALVFQIPRAALRASAQRLTMLPNRRTLLHLYLPRRLAARSPPAHERTSPAHLRVGVANDTNCGMTPLSGSYLSGGPAVAASRPQARTSYLAQEPKRQPRAPRPAHRIPSGKTRRHELLRPFRRQFANGQVLALKPAAESVKLPDPVVDRPRRISPSRQPRPVRRVKRRQRPRHPRNNRRSAHQQPPIQSRETKTRGSIGRRGNYPK